MARVQITLDGKDAAKLARLAEQLNVTEETLAQSLLARALDDADTDPRHVGDLLNSIPGAFERAELGLEQARRKGTTPLDRI